MTEPSTKANYVAALKLQRERSSMYQQWTSLFHRALIGDVTASELQRNIQGIVLPEFQRVSSALRTLQKSLATADTDVQSSSCDGQRVGASATLAAWIEQLQDLERDHYGVTLSLANQLVDHCTPNVLSAASTADSVEKKEKEEEREAKDKKASSVGVGASGHAEVVPVDIKSMFKPDDSDDERNDFNGEVEWREARTFGTPPQPQPPTSSSAPLPSASSAATASSSLSVHDNTRCALHRLIPPRFHTHLFFVDCKDGVDELAGASDAAAAVMHDSDNDEASEVLPVYAKESNDGAPLAFYAPRAIAQRCVEWSCTVDPIVRRQECLRAAVEDLCEELQDCISDM